MRNATPDRPSRSRGAEPAPHQPPSASPKRPRLSHRAARESLALLLDATTPPDQAEPLRRHVDVCARCQSELEQLRQAEAWLVAQPVEVPQMVARQSAAWAAIQARIAAEEGVKPAAEKARSNGHANGHFPAPNHHSAIEAAMLVPLVADSANPDDDEADRPLHPSALPQPPAHSPHVLSIFKKTSGFTPRRALFGLLAATLVVGSFAALFLARFSSTPSISHQTTVSPLFKMGVLDPGNATPAFSFDSLSGRLLSLTGEMSYDCPPGAHCPDSGPACLGFALMDVGTGVALSKLRPGCTPGRPTLDGDTYVSLLDDSAKGEALLVSNQWQVTAVDTLSGSVVNTYSLACCSNDYSMAHQPLLDQRDQLLLTAAQSDSAGVANTLVAQDATTGTQKYQITLDMPYLQAGLVSEATGWVYFWNRCAAASATSCVEVYEAKSGQKVASWQPTPEQTPLAADPTENVVYVREDQADGRSETLALDGRSGAKVAQLPAAAQAMAINAPLHHAYLLGDDGVTVVDTRTKRKLSTLPVLARDESWIAPAVDTRRSMLYVPIQRGKLLMVQDNPAGQLRLRSDNLATVLEAERALVVNAAPDEMALYPWELPLGPGSFTVYHPMWQGNQQDCGIGWVAARTGASISSQQDGHHQVQISLAWDDAFAQGTLISTPTPQPSYPHQHIWFYDVPASGAARLSSEHGEEISGC